MVAVLGMLGVLARAIDNGIGWDHPPMGWRSWNAFPCLDNKTIITQAHMTAQMKAAVDKSRVVGGRPTSLAEVGYDYISMDDGWQDNKSRWNSPIMRQPEP